MSQTTNPAPGYLEHFTARVLADALTEATVDYWVQRAEVFDAAAHRPGIDYPGRATPEQLQAQQARCRLTALACRQRAYVTSWGSSS